MTNKISKQITALSLFILCICSFVSCTKEPVSEFTDSPIIESYLREGGVLSVSISRQVPFSNNVAFSADSINNLSIKVDDNGTTHYLTSIDSGRYVDSTLIIAAGHTYQLSFNFNGKNVYATTIIPSKPINYGQSVTSMTVPQQQQGPPTGTIPDPLIMTWTNPDASYYFLVIQNIEKNPTAITLGASNDKQKSFRTPPTNLNFIEVRALDFTHYGNHRVILYHVLPDYASLYAANSNSSQNLSNPSSAITNGYGIFTGLNSDTLFVNIHY